MIGGNNQTPFDKYKRREAERFQELFVSSMFFTAAQDYEDNF